MRRSTSPRARDATKPCASLALESAAISKIPEEDRMRFIIRALALFAFSALAQAKNISIATAGPGGVYYPLGAGLPPVPSKPTPAIQAPPEGTGGSTAKLHRIGPAKTHPRLGLG